MTKTYPYGDQTFTLTITETATRLFYKTVKAKSLRQAERLAQAAVATGDWTEWDCSDSECHLDADAVRGVL